MKTSTPLIMILFLYLIFMGYAIVSAMYLPDQVASHFNLSGQPDGWMSRSEYLYVTLIFGSAFVLFMIMISLLSRFGPDWLVNIPHREHWFSPERRAETKKYLSEFTLWFGCWALFLFIRLNISVVNANKHVPIHLTNWEFYGQEFVFFILGTILGVYILWRHFSQIESGTSEGK